MLIISYLVFAFSPFLALPFTIFGILKDRKFYIHYALILSLFFANLAYSVTPKVEMDLTRYFMQLSSLQFMDWSTFIDTKIFEDFLYVQNLLFYAVSQSGDFKLLPWIVIFITYFITFYILLDYAKENKNNSFEIMYAIMFIIFLIPFVSMVSNVRNVLAFSIISLAIYRDLFKKKPGIITYMLYITPLFIHLSSLSLIILAYLAKKTLKFSAKSLFTFVIFFIVTSYIFFVPEILLSIPLIGEYTYSFFIKGISYFSNSASYEYADIVRESGFKRVQKLFYTSFVGTILLSILLLWKNNKDSIRQYIIYLCLIVLMCYPIIVTVYFRFTVAVLFFAPIVLLSSFKVIKAKNNKLLYISVLTTFMISGLVLQLIYLNRLVDVEQLLYDSISTSILKILF